MNNESSDLDPYEAVLADLKAKRTQIDQTIQLLESLRGETAGSPSQALNQNVAVEGPGAFLGMTVADAARKLLAIRRTPLSNPEIVAAITAGGVVMKSADPVNTVGAILHRRAKEVGDLVRVQRKWGLAEWYPNAARFAARKGNLKGEIEPSTPEKTNEPE